MATDTERLIFLLEANTKSLENALARGEKTAARRMAAMESRAALMEKRLQASFAKGGNAIANVISATAVAAVLKGTANLADAYTNLQNQAKIYTGSAQAAAQATQFVIDTAADARVGLADLTKVYAASSRAAKDFGASATEVENLTEVIAKSAATANAGPQALAGALNQLAQALPGARVEAEEFNSVIDGAFGVAQAAANGFEAAAGSVSKLQNIVRDGGLSGSQLFRALLSQLPEVRKQFEQVTPTIAGSFETLRTRLIEFIGGADDAAQATENISKFILGVAENIELLGDASRVFVGEIAKLAGAAAPIAAVGTAVLAVNGAFRAYATLAAAVAIANTGVAASTTVAAAATVGFTGALRGLLVASRAFVFSPLGLAITAVGLALAYATGETLKKIEADKQAEAATEARRKGIQGYVDAATAAANADGEAKKSAEAAAEAARKGAESHLQAARAMRDRASAAYETARAELALAQARRAEAVKNKSADSFARAGLQGDRKATIDTFNAFVADMNAKKEVAELEELFKGADTARKGGGVKAVPVPTKPKKGDSAASKEAKEAREKLKADKEALQIQKDNLEFQIKIAQYRGLNTDALEDELAVLERADDLAGRGVPTAKGTAQAQREVATVRALILEQREQELKAIEKANQAEIAGLQGKFAEQQALEDQLAIRERADKYEDLKVDRAEALVKATQDVKDLRQAAVAAAETEFRIEDDKRKIEELMLKGKFAEAEVAARVLEVEQRRLELAQKGLSNAAERAEEVQKELDDLREIERLRSKEERRVDREIELLRLRGLDREAERRQRQADAEATARGNARADGRDYNPTDATALFDENQAADLEGKVREAWRDGIKAALSGDFEDFLSNILQRAFDRAAESLGDALFDIIKGQQARSGEGSSGGNGFFSTIMKALPYLLNSGGGGGARANGGSVSRGKSYLVGENGPELFTAGASGVIHPGGRSRAGGGVSIVVNANDAVLASQMREDMIRAVAQGVQIGRAQDRRQTELMNRYRGK
jgi:tape measure domain-containing protein